jgi:hypothetical protein
MLSHGLPASDQSRKSIDLGWSLINTNARFAASASHLFLQGIFHHYFFTLKSISKGLP